MPEILTYFRKKRPGKKKAGFLSVCMPSEKGVLSQQAVDVSGDQEMFESLPELTEAGVSNVHSQVLLEGKNECLANSMSVQATGTSRLPDVSTGRRKRRRLRKLSGDGVGNAEAWCMNLESSRLPQAVNTCGDQQMPESHLHSPVSLECKTECLANNMFVQAPVTSRLPDTSTGRKKRRRLRKATGVGIENAVSLPLCNTETSLLSRDNPNHHDDSSDSVKEAFIKDIKVKMKKLSALGDVLDKTEKVAEYNGSGMNFRYGTERSNSYDGSDCKYLCLSIHV